LTLALEILTLAVGAALMVRLLPRATARVRPASRALPTQRPEDLQRIQRLVWVGQSSAAEVHLRLAPLLREIAAARLERRGISLDREPDAARLALGDELWELTRPNRPRPKDPRGPGIPLEQLEALTDRLERM
jgi:hypothetical protein